MDGKVSIFAVLKCQFILQSFHVFHHYQNYIIPLPYFGVVHTCFQSETPGLKNYRNLKVTKYWAPASFVKVPFKHRIPIYY